MDILGNDIPNLIVNVQNEIVNEALYGTSIKHTYTICSDSNVTLDKLYLHISIYEKFILERLFTGQYSHVINMNIFYKTNLQYENLIPLESNLLTNENIEIDISKIPLKKNEYIKDIFFEFIDVPSGFREVERAFIFTYVNDYGSHVYNKVYAYALYNGEEKWKEHTFNVATSRY